MKIGFISDIHLRGGYDSEEAIALRESAYIFIENEVSLVCILGDVYEDSSTPEQRIEYRRFLEILHLRNIETLSLRGNHDKANDLELFNGIMGHYHCERYNTILKEINGENFLINIIPHFSAGALALQTDSVEEFNRTGIDLFTSILEGIYQRIQNHSGPSMVIFHGTVSGARLDNNRIPRANGIYLPLAVLESFGCPVVGGHYHKYQNVGGRVWYPGSITRQTWGESADDKGVLIWECNEGEWKKEPEFISLNPIPMITVDATWDGERLLDIKSGETIEPSQIVGNNSKIRLRLDVAKEISHTVPKDLEKSFSSAIDVKIEKNLISEISVRSEKITQVESIEDSINVWMELKGIEDTERDAVLEEYKKIKSELELSKEKAA